MFKLIVLCLESFPPTHLPREEGEMYIVSWLHGILLIFFFFFSSPYRKRAKGLAGSLLWGEKMSGSVSLH